MIRAITKWDDIRKNIIRGKGALLILILVTSPLSLVAQTTPQDSSLALIQKSQTITSPLDMTNHPIQFTLVGIDNEKDISLLFFHVQQKDGTIIYGTNIVPSTQRSFQWNAKTNEGSIANATMVYKLTVEIFYNNGESKSVSATIAFTQGGISEDLIIKKPDVWLPSDRNIEKIELFSFIELWTVDGAAYRGQLVQDVVGEIRTITVLEYYNVKKDEWEKQEDDLVIDIAYSQIKSIKKLQKRL